MNQKIERVKRRIDDIKKEREELKEKYDYLVEELKKTVDKNSQEIDFLKNEMEGLSGKEGKDEENVSDLRSFANSLEKSINSLQGKHDVLKEKVTEDMKSIGKDINSRLLEKVKSINSNVKAQIKEAASRNEERVKFITDKVSGFTEKLGDYEANISEISGGMKSLRDSIADLEVMGKELKSQVMQRVSLLEKEMNSELAKVKGFEERLNKDVEDFEKFASDQKARMEKFESGVSNKIDMFAMDKENLKRDFSSISNDFKNIGHRLDSLKEKDAELSQRVHTSGIEVENFKKVTEEVLTKVKEDQTVFKENVTAKLNEASDKILSRLSQNEIRNASEISKQSEEIKLFRAHVTQFINDLVANYEKRFEMMKSEIDRSLKTLEERMREQRAMIFE